jgi:hypothetical protein
MARRNAGYEKMVLSVDTYISAVWLWNADTGK